MHDSWPRLVWIEHDVHTVQERHTGERADQDHRQQESAQEGPHAVTPAKQKPSRQ